MRWTIVFVLIACPAAALDYMRAQGDMITRVERAVDEFSRKIGATTEMKAYCRVEMDLATVHYPKNGSIPFGVAYNEIVSQETLDLVIYNREAFEKNFLMRCLSQTVKDLSLAR